MSGAIFYRFITKLILFVIISSFTILNQSEFALAKTTINMGPNFDGTFGLGFDDEVKPKSKKKNASHLPYCEDLKDYEGAPGVKINHGYCLGDIAPEDPEAKKYELILFGEFFDKDGELVRIIKRNPVLLSLAQFLNVCRPLGGLTDTEGLYCQYTVKF